MRNKIIIALLAGGILASCSKKLDLLPVNDLTPATTYSSVEGYKGVLAKIYGTLSSTGNSGPAGSADINGLDEGSQISFIRMFFNCEELPTEEAIVAWNDQTIWDFHNLSWTSSDPFLKGIYARPVYNITLINEYLRESTADKLSGHGITGADAESIKNTRGEVRFLRAFNYWVMMDLFGKSTFITEDDGVGTFLPREISRTDLFNYIESELNTAITELPAPRTAEYGRVDQAAAWALLARMYLNAEVYTGTAHWTDALTNAQKVINAGYTLAPNYRNMFMADNNETSASELIFTINCDGLRTTSYGNTTFLIHAASSGDEADYGITAGNGWGGYRATAGLADKFTDLSGSTDQRAMFTTSKFGTSSDQIKIPAIGDFQNGLHVNKFRNIRSDAGAVHDPNQYFSDIDFPVFRLGEMYLIYAEAVLRGGAGGDIPTALGYMNNLRERAYGNTSGNITSGQLDLNYVLDERARELYWEGHRRTDLIRYGLLTTGTYLWPWKGGAQNGTSVSSKYNIFPVPAVNLTSNTNLTQNTGY